MPSTSPPLPPLTSAGAAASSTLSPRVKWSYSLAKLSLAALETLFSLYYIDVFLNVYKLTNWWFYLGQSVYIVWNALNDPLFAYFQDRVVGSKQSALYYGGPLLGLAFMLPFVPLGQWVAGGGGELGGVGAGAGDGAGAGGLGMDACVGLHFILSMFVFDGVYTFACLAHCALFADITAGCGSGSSSNSSSSGDAVRIDLLRLGEASMLLLGPLLFLSQSVFERGELTAFRWMGMILACVCARVLMSASRHLRGTTESSTTTATATTEANGAACSHSSSMTASLSAASPPPPPLSMFLRQLLSHRSFLLFVALNFLQVFTLTFLNNFTLIIVAALNGSGTASAGGGVGGAGGLVEGLMGKGGVGLALSACIPPLIVVALTSQEETEASASSSSSSSPPPPPDRAYRVVRGMTQLKIALSLCMFLLGSSGPLGRPCFVAFLFLSRGLATATFSFFNVILADLVDEDRVRYGRVAGGMSSSYFGINALFTKPAQSIAPMLAVGLWSQYGFRSRSEDGVGGAAEGEVDPILSSPMADQLQHVIFLCCTLGLLLTGVVQLILWHFYNLRGARLIQVKQRLHALTSAAASAAAADDISLEGPEDEFEIEVELGRAGGAGRGVGSSLGPSPRAAVGGHFDVADAEERAQASPLLADKRRD